MDIPERFCEPKSTVYNTIYNLNVLRNLVVYSQRVYWLLKNAGLEGIDSKNVLEVACGVGVTSYVLAEYLNLNVTGLDNDSASIAHAKQYFSNTPGLEFDVGSVYDLTLYRNKFDSVVCIFSLHHFNRLNQAIEEIFNSMTPGGLFYFVDFNRNLALYDPDPTNSSPTLTQAIYDYWQTHGEKRMIDHFFNNCLRGIPTLSESQETVLASWSQLAAYTPQEVKAALATARFQEIEFDLVDEPKFIGKAKKP